MPAVGDPHLSGGKLVKDQPFAFVARVEVKPNVTGEGLQGPDAEDARRRGDRRPGRHEQIESSSSARTTVEPVTGRDVVQAGDMVVIDFDATMDGSPSPATRARTSPSRSPTGELIEGNLPQLEGAKVGGTRSSTTPSPPTTGSTR